MGVSENSFTLSFPGEIMVTMMRRGLEYEGKKNALTHVGYEETLKKWEEKKELIQAELGRAGLTNDEFSLSFVTRLKSHQCIAISMVTLGKDIQGTEWIFQFYLTCYVKPAEKFSQPRPRRTVQESFTEVYL